MKPCSPETTYLFVGGPADGQRMIVLGGPDWPRVTPYLSDPAPYVEYEPVHFPLNEEDGCITVFALPGFRRADVLKQVFDGYCQPQPAEP